jgi:phenylpyruvate tautomerase PptA (4-oxalocrotonate tautomerase family)
MCDETGGDGIAFIDLPPGLKADTKKKLVKDVADSIHYAYLIPDTRVFLREWPAQQMSIGGQLGAPMRPICDFVLPPGLPVEGKRQLVKQVSVAIAGACNLPLEEIPLLSGKKVSTRWVLDFSSVCRLPVCSCGYSMSREQRIYSSQITRGSRAALIPEPLAPHSTFPRLSCPPY